MASYRNLYESGKLESKVRLALEALSCCRLCPRNCGVNRLMETGFCRTGRYAHVASYGSHFGEERELSGRYGSGTIFFSACNLRCSFCQNFEIAHADAGEGTPPERIADMMCELEGQGCHNINFVTPSHVVPQVLEALLIACKNGLDLPLVYNTSGYDSTAALELVDGIFDIYLPDFKFFDSSVSGRYCNAPDYPRVAKRAIKQMHAQSGDLVIDEDGIAVSGLIVRHLVMPGGIAGTPGIMRFLAEEVSKRTRVNVMGQYRPCFNASGDEIINRPITAEEYVVAVATAKSFGLEVI